MTRLIKKKRNRKPLRMSFERVGCPFCWEWLPPPKHILNVFSGEGCMGGHCECGAVFVIDETGRLSGQALIDAQALACDGDLDKALTLDSKKDFEIKTRVYQATSRRFGDRVRGHSYLPPKVWAIKLHKD